MSGKFENLIQRLFPEISTRQIQQLNHYIQAIKNYGRKINLVSHSDLSHLWEKHIFPSVIVDKIFGIPQSRTLLDLGSGAGFPALPLKIVRPDLQIILTESVRKKALFLKKVISDLDLKNASVLNLRITAEEMDNYLIPPVSLVTARSVADIETLYQLSIPFLEPGGFLLLWKGRKDIPELEQVSQKYQFHYEVRSVDLKYHPYAEPLSRLIFIKIIPNKNNSIPRS